jgi:hypothetical protein
LKISNGIFGKARSVIGEFTGAGAERRTMTNEEWAVEASAWYQKSLDWHNALLTWQKNAEDWYKAAIMWFEEIHPVDGSLPPIFPMPNFPPPRMIKEGEIPKDK